MLKTLSIVTTALLVFSLPVQADLVKKSRSGICHDSSSSSYNKTKNFTSYDTLNECLESGGRLPKSYKVPASKKPVQSHDSSPGYDRDKFGKGWDDTDGDCLNTRHELLLAQSTSTIDRGKNRCTIDRGRWLDPYTGKTFYSARDVDIDHLVPLKWAWDHGADKWSDQKREQIANDEMNLFAVQASVNRQKGAKGPLEWMPPAQSFHCQYVSRFLRVVTKYGLELSPEEKRGFETLRQKSCGK